MQLGRYPNSQDIDQILTDRPVFLYRNCHHIAVMNSKALQLLNITETSEDPVGGSIEKYNGKPTGKMTWRFLRLMRLKELSRKMH